MEESEKITIVAFFWVSEACPTTSVALPSSGYDYYLGGSHTTTS